MKRSLVRRRFWLIMLLTAVAALVSAPKDYPVKFSVGPIRVDTVISSPEIDWRIARFRFFRDLRVKKGLDLQGGTQLILEAVMDDIPVGDRDQAIEAARTVIARRVDLYGISETVVQTARSGEGYRVIVELPGVTDPGEALALVGQTAKLTFREPAAQPELGQAGGPRLETATGSGQALMDEIGKMMETGLTGEDLKRAEVQFSSGQGQTAGEPAVALTFTSDGRDKFAEVTRRNVGKRVGIFLDEVPLTVPVVQTPILDGRAIISGGFELAEAKKLVVNLNAGALPVDLEPIAQSRIGATLGEESVSASVEAGLIGLAVVSVFMILVYRKLGLIAVAALIIYGLLTLSVYKLIPVTLTLPGVAGFLLSVGMATDANILIFERTKEELRRGRKLRAAVELGFGRAWDSIKDANMATLLTAFILYNPFDWSFLNSSGMIRGFALTLSVGIAIGLFTGVVVSRTLIRMFYISNKKQATRNKGIR